MTSTLDLTYDLISVTRAVFEILRPESPATSSVESPTPTIVPVPVSAPAPAPHPAVPVTPVPVTRLPVTPLPVAPAPVAPPLPTAPAAPPPVARSGARSGDALAILDEIAFLDE
ncbi:hypothetical protein DDE18_16155 [Nocardioides gansuensis]|uniref:Uncharacterized protein n=1 Tax=Nocardioides gansuensis TaxID=2138300 RepID=A0A2T8F745_9ACTN|nr:hypothetical protein [Nocardioides gansuensis]PVG81544.1 hypothetical protein DDE18_16155 [Nocardioides gansuensis]